MTSGINQHNTNNVASLALTDKSMTSPRSITAMQTKDDGAAVLAQAEGMSGDVCLQF